MQSSIELITVHSTSGGPPAPETGRGTHTHPQSAVPFYEKTSDDKGLSCVLVGDDTNSRTDNGTFDAAPVDKNLSSCTADCGTHHRTLQIRIDLVAR